ncbi:hypothetical protein HG535_0A00390 [Zygotorulaspora mrakii]|uniref:Plasma membrane proteolipid 3 n=1 Tax=Zygotorulaspora mrakii TaxID=42260 RepID=A0A7H9AWF4_ZYGMR|nr:uncharacterized protein HG535_0A00390 [Zygotorulaspora mrakii]QLG70099.1 hypothetical protein HG535_0A00390 [Zygotorulaspora mrakii]
MHARDWFLVFIAIFLPPVAVWIKRGFFTKDFLINVLLFLLGFLPGLVHALWVISQHPFEKEGQAGLLEPANNNDYGATA